MADVKILVLRAPGTNRDEETAFAFTQAGGRPELVHINQLVAGEKKLADYQVLAIPGGFSYGDDLGAGRVEANELYLKLADRVAPFLERGGLAIGICNGFQVLVKAGILPGPMSAGQTVTLTNNDSGRFECRWVYLAGNPQSRCIFTRGIELIYVPIAHGEGKLVAPPAVLEKLDAALYYADAGGNVSDVYPNCPNGSMRCIAGLTDATGRVFGLMPHPEDSIRPTQLPRWTRGGSPATGGFRIFQNAVDWVKRS